MTIWIFNSYGSLPGEGWRDYRSTLIANAFNKEGHEVVWFTSNFEHRSKKFRSTSWEEVMVNPLYKIVLVPSTAYKGHISLQRIKSERNYAANLKRRLSATEEKADLIIIGEPAVFVSDILMKIVKSKNAKLIIDIIDLWPELFNIMLPKQLSWTGKLIFAPMYWRRSWFLKKADGIIAVARDYLELGKQYNRTPFSEVVYWGVDTKSLLRLKDGYEMQSLKQLEKKPGEKWVIYAGTLGDNYDLRTIMQCAQKLEQHDLKVRVLIAGDGSLKEYVQNFIDENKLRKTIYLGRLSASDLNKLYVDCDMALSSYVSRSTVSMSVKTYDYLTAGLPLINSLGRDLGEFVSAKKVGIQYKAENRDSMFDAILSLASNDRLRSKMRENALALAQYFDSEIQYEKLVKLASEIIKKV